MLIQNLNLKNFEQFTISNIYFNTAKSPVFAQMTSTILGITTIRACKMKTQLTAEFDELQNIHSGVWQTLMSINTG